MARPPARPATYKQKVFVTLRMYCLPKASFVKPQLGKLSLEVDCYLNSQVGSDRPVLCVLRLALPPFHAQTYQKIDNMLDPH